ncbi:sphingosine-1-phosphate lyase-like [Uloborus diversus]|uniref:sphingosine-1-phosphate lyase-like n=1 Tax=Uloborus diversus TaxID=327109 RepID=UPI0024099D46|nr:sphingosine-1-phosphate lyase-like [Uloborus diversus]
MTEEQIPNSLFDLQYQQRYKIQRMGFGLSMPLQGRPIAEDGMYHFWHFFRSLPFIKQSIQKKIDSSSREIESQLQKGLENKVFIKNMPEKKWSKEDIMKELNQYLGFGDFAWNEGYVSGAVYSGNDKELYNLMKEVYGATSYTNPLHPDVFPGIRVMEAEIVHMVASLFHAPKAIGTVTSGGTESIFLVCKAYRDFARFEKGIKSPNMVIPVTAHAAFDKAAHMLKIQVKHVKFDPKTTKVDIRAMKKAIDSSTCMLVGSAPAFPHGSIDCIEEIGKLGCQNKIPVHVDACLGGFLIPFMEEAGHSVPPFDFRLPGVTSISIDTHKYAYAPKGSSVILYREKIHRHYQFSVQPDWPGGIYGTPNLGGSRSGGVIATCWSALLFHGKEAYVECTKKIIDVTKYIEDGLRKIPHIHIIGKPEVSVIAIGTQYFDIYRLSGALTHKGWNLNALQFPSGFHLCVTQQHTKEGVADKFLKDVQDCTEEIMKQPNLPTTGTAAIYGMAQQIPDRSVVSELVWTYLDACYSIKTDS